MALTKPEDLVLLILNYLSLEDYIILSKKLESSHDPSVWYIPVSALAGCSHKYHILRKYRIFNLFTQPFVAKEEKVLVGKLVHKGLQTTIKELLEKAIKEDDEFSRVIKEIFLEMGITDIKKIKVEEWVQREFLLEIDGKPIKVVLTGRADLYLEDTNKIVVEIKTTSKPRKVKQPLPEYEIQLKTYMNLFKADLGLLIVFSPAGFSYFKYTEGFTDDELEELLMKIIKDEKIERSHCKSCPFRNVCMYSSYQEDTSVASYTTKIRLNKTLDKKQKWKTKNSYGSSRNLSST